MNITITNGKGGTGKTTLNIFLAEWLCSHGYKVLIVDLDPNCSISEVYKMVLQDQNSKLLLTGRSVVPYKIKENGKGGSLSIIPSDLDLDMISNIIDVQVKIQLKKQGFTEMYDYILIDPPGTWNAQTRNALYASDSIVVVGKCSPLDFEATKKFIGKLEESGLESELCIVCNSYNAQFDPDNIWGRYQATFKEALLSKPLPRLTSLKRLSENVDYRIRFDLASRLSRFVEKATLNSVKWEE